MRQNKNFFLEMMINKQRQIQIRYEFESNSISLALRFQCSTKNCEYVISYYKFVFFYISIHHIFYTIRHDSRKLASFLIVMP